MTTNFEAKLHGFRRTQDGVVVSYVVHPSDVSAELATAALGTRYMVAVAEIGDDERPIDLGPDPKKLPIADIAEERTGVVAKDRRPFASMPLSQQCAMRCQDNDFKLFMEASNAEDAAKKVREYCGVTSRSQLDDPKMASARHLWTGVEAEYQAYLTDRQYADNVHHDADARPDFKGAGHSMASQPSVLREQHEAHQCRAGASMPSLRRETLKERIVGNVITYNLTAVAPDPIYALASVWASIDGKLERFATDMPGSPDGCRDGYMIEAEEAVRRLLARGFKLVPITG